MSESIFMCPRNHSECAALCESCQIVELQAQVAALEAPLTLKKLARHLDKTAETYSDSRVWMLETAAGLLRIASIELPTAREGEVPVSGRIVGGEPIYDQIGVVEPEGVE